MEVMFLTQQWWAIPMEQKEPPGSIHHLQNPVEKMSRIKGYKKAVQSCLTDLPSIRFRDLEINVEKWNPSPKDVQSCGDAAEYPPGFDDKERQRILFTITTALTSDQELRIWGRNRIAIPWSGSTMWQSVGFAPNELIHRKVEQSICHSPHPLFYESVRAKRIDGQQMDQWTSGHSPWDKARTANPHSKGIPVEHPAPSTGDRPSASRWTSLSNSLILRYHNTKINLLQKGSVKPL